MIELRNNQKLLKINKQSVSDLCNFVLESLNLQDCNVSVSLVDDKEITELNLRYFRKNRTTDVISFPMEDNIRDGALLGDVVVCLREAVRSSNEQGLPLCEEISLYLIHGILHLVGERDGTSAERRKMGEKQELLLAGACRAKRLVRLRNSS
jgi:probable rRNA maturation factor